MATIMDLVQPRPEAKWVVFYSLGDGPDGGLYYDTHSIEQMRYHLTMLAYDMNGAPLSYGHGAPLRLRNEVQFGFKQVKWLAGIEFVAHYSQVGGGYGGYNPDHEFFGYRQSISSGLVSAAHSPQRDVSGSRTDGPRRGPRDAG